MAPGRRSRHLAVTVAGTAAVAGLVGGRRRLALAGAAAWAFGTAELARIAPGPGTRQEILTMALTSAAIPPAAT